MINLKTFEERVHARQGFQNFQDKSTTVPNLKPTSKNLGINTVILNEFYGKRKDIESSSDFASVPILSLLIQGLSDFRATIIKIELRHSSFPRSFILQFGIFCFNYTFGDPLATNPFLTDI